MRYITFNIDINRFIIWFYTPNTLRKPDLNVSKLRQLADWLKILPDRKRSYESYYDVPENATVMTAINLWPLTVMTVTFSGTSKYILQYINVVLHCVSERFKCALGSLRSNFVANYQRELWYTRRAPRPCRISIRKKYYIFWKKLKF